MGLLGALESLLGVQQSNDYTVKDNRTSQETGVRDADALERFAKDKQKEDPFGGRPKPFGMRITDRH